MVGIAPDARPGYRPLLDVEVSYVRHAEGSRGGGDDERSGGQKDRSWPANVHAAIEQFRQKLSQS